MARRLLEKNLSWILAFGAALAILVMASVMVSTGVIAAGGDEGEPNAGKKIFAAGYRFEVEPITVQVVKSFPGRIKPGESAEMRFAISNHSPATDWVVSLELKFDFSNVAIYGPDLGVAASVLHENGAAYNLGSPLVISAGGTRTIVIRVTADDGAGMVVVHDVSVYRLRPFVDGLG